jgi:hypothetical protein
MHPVVEALIEIGELDRAVDLVANDPDSINILLTHLARALPKVKDREQARAILRLALDRSALSRYPGERGQALAEIAGIQAAIGDFERRPPRHGGWGRARMHH